ncbi:MAG TPA: hypothetical protein VF468_11525, partial [Actinomycetota bacterium]|nr:hypothetical protein [Actinomycetota bacterium]
MLGIQVMEVPAREPDGPLGTGATVSICVRSDRTEAVLLAAFQQPRPDRVGDAAICRRAVTTAFHVTPTPPRWRCLGDQDGGVGLLVRRGAR